MASEDQLVDDIAEASPDILFLGEIHTAESQYRETVLRLLPRLPALGYGTLALELMEETLEAVERFCRDDNYSMLAACIGEHGSKNFDSALMTTVKLLVKEGIKLTLVNSRDPDCEPGQDNSIGRDEFMATKLTQAACNGKVVALLGEAHCYVRTDRTCFSSSIASGEVLSEKMQYRTAAEKVVQKGASIYSFNEYSILNDLNRRKDYPSFLVLRREMDDGLINLKHESYAGEVGSVAPELIEQTFLFKPSDANALYIDVKEPPPPVLPRRRINGPY